MVFGFVIETAVVLSPLNSFMAASQTSFTDKNNETAITLRPLSSIDTVSRGKIVLFGLHDLREIRLSSFFAFSFVD